MIFRKKIKNLQQERQPLKRMDGIVTYASINKKALRQKSVVKEKKFFEAGIYFGKFFRKLKKIFFLNSIFSKRIFASLVILIIVFVGFFQNSQRAQSATYTWQQTDWSGGQTTNSDVHPGAVGGWKEYSAKDSFVQTTNGGSDVELSWTAGSSLQTSETGVQDTPNAGGFNAGNHNQTKGRAAGTDARVDLAYGGVAAISSGLGHNLLIKSDNTVWSWGENGSGQLGDTTSTPRLTPVQVRNSADNGYLASIEAVAAGNTHSLALDADGTVWAWGRWKHWSIGSRE